MRTKELEIDWKFWQERDGIYIYIDIHIYLYLCRYTLINMHISIYFFLCLYCNQICIILWYTRNIMKSTHNDFRGHNLLFQEVQVCRRCSYNTLMGSLMVFWGVGVI